MSRLEEFTKYLWQDSAQPDEITQMLFRSWDELYSMDRQEVADWQLESARHRFNTLRPQINVLDAQATEAGVDHLDSLSDIVPLLFQHTQYKSYPLSLLEKRRYDMLTKWLDGFTTIDLSNVDVSGCNNIDEWLEQLEVQAQLYIFHTTGTTGKLSFIPKDKLDADLLPLSYLKPFEPDGKKPGVYLGFDGERLPYVYPSSRHGRYTAQRILDLYAQYVTPTPEQLITLDNGLLSAELVSLSGRVRVAQSKGELHKMQLDDAQKQAMKRYLDDFERRPEELDAFMQRIFKDLEGQKVFIGTQASMMTQAAEKGLARGLKNVFAPGSIGTIGGGNKDMKLPENWLEMAQAFTGIQDWNMMYGMSENLGSAVMCENGHYHLPPYTIAFLLDPETGEALPREGVQTGRFAFLDLLPHSYWGAIVTGDKVTIDWDNDCGCGRNTAFIHDPIVRYSETVTGDDKVTCSATVDNTDSALQELLAA